MEKIKHKVGDRINVNIHEQLYHFMDSNIKSSGYNSLMRYEPTIFDKFSAAMIGVHDYYIVSFYKVRKQCEQENQ